jgi:glutaredoxin 3
MTQITGRTSVPQIFIGATHVGGCDDLHALDAQGGLLPLLQA